MAPWAEIYSGIVWQCVVLKLGICLQGRSDFGPEGGVSVFPRNVGIQLATTEYGFTTQNITIWIPLCKWHFIFQDQGLVCNILVLWHVDPFLGNDREVSKKIQKPLLSNGFVNKHDCTETIGKSNRGTACSVRSLSRCYKQTVGAIISNHQPQRAWCQDKMIGSKSPIVVAVTLTLTWVNSGGQSPTGKNVSTNADDIVGIPHKETTCEDTAD
jgi:hypothetical protein